MSKYDSSLNPMRVGIGRGSPYNVYVRFVRICIIVRFRNCFRPVLFREIVLCVLTHFRKRALIFRVFLVRLKVVFYSQGN